MVSISSLHQTSWDVILATLSTFYEPKNRSRKTGYARGEIRARAFVVIAEGQEREGDRKGAARSYLKASEALKAYKGESAETPVEELPLFIPNGPKNRFYGTAPFTIQNSPDTEASPSSPVQPQREASNRRTSPWWHVLLPGAVGIVIAWTAKPVFEAIGNRIAKSFGLSEQGTRKQTEETAKANTDAEEVKNS